MNEIVRQIPKENVRKTRKKFDSCQEKFRIFGLFSRCFSLARAILCRMATQETRNISFVAGLSFAAGCREKSSRDCGIPPQICRADPCGVAEFRAVVSSSGLFSVKTVVFPSDLAKCGSDSMTLNPRCKVAVSRHDPSRPVGVYSPPKG